jgi:hypothetical protein
MSAHTLSRATRTLELAQLFEINEQLLLDPTVAPDRMPLTAELFGLDGALVHTGVVDRAAALVVPRQERRREPQALPATALLQRLLAAGTPTFPYLYGVFAEASPGRRELPVPMHSEHLRRVSSLLGLRRHQWGA